MGKENDQEVEERDAESITCLWCPFCGVLVPLIYHEGHISPPKTVMLQEHDIKGKAENERCQSGSGLQIPWGLMK